MLFFIAWLTLSLDAQAQEISKEKPVTVAYFYKVKWGYQSEFLELYKKNHYPVLEAMVKSGRLLEVQTWTPRFHGAGRSDWTFMSVLGFTSWEAMADTSQEQKNITDLFPDQERFQQEEQRRFEILEAHWGCSTA